MSGTGRLGRLSGGTKFGLAFGVVMLLAGFNTHSWGAVLAGLGLLGVLAWKNRAVFIAPDTADPWPWPADFRATAECMARPLDPTPKRVLPADDKTALVAHVATTKEALATLIADKPPAWPWAVFTSVLVQRRNAVAARLRACVSGYQPRAGLAPVTGQAYSGIAYQSMRTIADLVAQLEQFMLSPAFTGAFGDVGDEDSADADAIVANANRLMDYHESFLRQAEACLQTPVQSDAFVFVHDMGAFALCPLIGFEQFIPTMCTRIGEAQDLLPYADPKAVVGLETATLGMSVPDGLSERITSHINRFNP